MEAETEGKTEGRTSSISEELSESSSVLQINRRGRMRSKSATEYFGSINSLNGLTPTLSASNLSPRWGEPGRKLPSVSSMLQLPSPMVAQQPSTAIASDDIEDIVKEGRQRDELLIEELAKATPKVLVSFTSSDSLCPDCKRPGK